MREVTRRAASGPSRRRDGTLGGGQRLPPDASLLSSLQSTAGNQAVQQLLARQVIQRAVGLEFQVGNTHLWSGGSGVSAPNSQAVPNALPQPSAPRKLLPYGEEVFREPGKYKVESDDGELEFVTAAFPEDGVGLAELAVAVSDAARFANLIPAHAKPATRVNDIAGGYGSGQQVGRQGQASPWLGNFWDPSNYPHADALLAKPQATFGLTLDNLIDFARSMAAGKVPMSSTGTGKWKKSYAKEKASVAEWGEAFVKHYKRLEEGHPKASSAVKGYVTLLQTYIKEARDVAARPPEDAELERVRKDIADAQQKIDAIEAELKKPDLADSSRTLLTGFHEEWLQAYADQVDTLKKLQTEQAAYKSAGYQPLEYPKSAHPIMARTNFKGMLLMLDGEDQSAAQSIVYQTLLLRTGRAQSERLYPGGYYKDELDKSEWGKVTSKSLGAIVPGPTIGEWLASIFTGVPGLKAHDTAPSTAGMAGRTAPHLPDTPAKRGMGALAGGDAVASRQGSDPNQQAVLKEAPAFEFRLFEGPLEPAQWPVLASEFARLVLAHNAPGGVTLSGEERERATPKGGKLPALEKT